jgi:hypothetical protein
VDDLHAVQHPQAEQTLDEVAPDGVLLDEHLPLAALVDLLGQVAPAHVLHHDAQLRVVVVGEGLLVPDDVLVVDGTQDLDLTRVLWMAELSILESEMTFMA